MVNTHRASPVWEAGTGGKGVVTGNVNGRGHLPLDVIPLQRTVAFLTHF